MIWHYLKITFRNLTVQRGYSLINIAGLSISLAVTVLMLLWVQDEWSMDKFHKKGDNLYRVKRTIPLEGNSLDVYNSIPYPVLSAAQNELPEVPLHFEFVDKQYHQQYHNEELTGTLASYFALFSILISCLGLLGLATFFAEQKTKEIGTRKVLGASFLNLAGLLSNEFSMLVSIGLFIGIPVAWYLMDNWLGKFEYNIGMEFWMVVLPVSLAISIAGVTVGYQAIRTASVNPIESLRNE